MNCEWKGDDLHDNLMDESLEFWSPLGLLPLVAMQRVHQPRDQPGGEDGSVGFVEVLEISQRVQPPRTQHIDKATQEEQSRGQDVTSRSSDPDQKKKKERGVISGGK